MNKEAKKLLKVQNSRQEKGLIDKEDGDIVRKKMELDISKDEEVENAL